MKLFWSKGFDGTSVDELAESMGLGRPSMYNAFGDKAAVFLRCLARYDETVAGVPLQALQAAPTAAEGLATYYRMIVTSATANPTHRGCFLVSTLNDDPKVQAFLTERMDAATQVIERRLDAAVAAGELPAQFPVKSRARRATNAMLALAARARQGVAREELQLDADDALASVLAPV